MARYSSSVAKATLSTTVGAWALEGSTSRRAKVYEFILGTSSAPADAAITWRLTRTSTANTGTGKTEAPLDPADPAATSAVKDEVTAEGTLGDVIMDVGMHQRSTFRWVASPGGQLVIPATANAGILWRTPIAGGTPGVIGTVAFEE